MGKIENLYFYVHDFDVVGLVFSFFFFLVCVHRSQEVIQDNKTQSRHKQDTRLSTLYFGIFGSFHRYIHKSRLPYCQGGENRKDRCLYVMLDGKSCRGWIQLSGSLRGKKDRGIEIESWLMSDDLMVMVMVV